MIIKNTEKYMKVIRYSLIPFGYFLNITGKLTKKQHIELLGHYLTCSGRKYKLDYNVLKKAIENKNKRISVTNKAYIELIPIPKIRYAFIGMPRGQQYLNNILGKFIVIVDEEGYFKIVDEYKFYPCKAIDSFAISTHNTSWVNIDIISIGKNIKEKFQKHLPKKIAGHFRKFAIVELNKEKVNPFSLPDLEITTNKNIEDWKAIMSVVICMSGNSYIHFKFSILDKFFYFLGKRFNVETDKFKLSEEMTKNILRDWVAVLNATDMVNNNEEEDNY